MKIVFNDNELKRINTSQKKISEQDYNCRVALWQIPYDSRYIEYDTDESKWFEAINKNNENEIANAEKNLHISLNKYKTYTQTLKYDDSSVSEMSIYPSGNIVKVEKTDDYVFVKIIDNSGKVAAEKCYNYSSNEGRKTIYKHFTQNDNTFTVVRIFSYDTTKNRSSDFVNFGYTSAESDLTKGCTLEKEYYLLNGKEVKAELNDNFEYSVKDEQGNNLTFKAN